MLSIEAVVEIASWHLSKHAVLQWLVQYWNGFVSLGVYSAPAKTYVSISLSRGLVQKIRTVVNKILPKEKNIISQQKFAGVIRK